MTFDKIVLAYLLLWWLTFLFIYCKHYKRIVLLKEPDNMESVALSPSRTDRRTSNEYQPSVISAGQMLKTPNADKMMPEFNSNS